MKSKFFYPAQDSLNIFRNEKDTGTDNDNIPCFWFIHEPVSGVKMELVKYPFCLFFNMDLPVPITEQNGKARYYSSISGTTKI